MRRCVYGTSLVVLSLAASLGQAQAPTRTLRAGAAKADITSAAAELPYTAPGERPFVGVHDPVFARALVLEDGANRVALVSLEVTAVPDAAKFVHAVAQAAGTVDAHVILTATHTHNVLLVSNHGGDPGPVLASETARALKGVVDATADAVARLQPATISFVRTAAWDNINNGEAAGSLAAHDPSGPSSKDLDILRVQDRAGKPLALLLNYASHAEVMFRSVTRDGGYEVSGDLPGAVSRILEQKVPGAPTVLFTPAAEADQLPFFKSLQPEGVLPATDEGAAGWALLDLLARDIASAALLALKAPAVPGRNVSLRVATGSVTCPGQRYELNHTTGTRTLQDQPPVTVGLSLFRMPGIVVAGVTADLSNDIGLAIQAALPAEEHTVVITMMAGAVGYVLSDASYVHPGHAVYGSPLKPGCAEPALTKRFQELYQQTVTP